MDFVDAGKNVIVAGEEYIAKPMRDFAFECGVTFDPNGSLTPSALRHHRFVTDALLGYTVVDHVKGDPQDHSRVALTNFVDVSTISGDAASRKPVLYQGPLPSSTLK